jgi:YidC/Oxa1 family membrane protein insertase
MMEKRALLAIALVFLLFFFYQYYVASQRRAVQAPEEAAEELVAEGPVEPAGGERAAPGVLEDRQEVEDVASVAAGPTAQAEVVEVPGADAPERVIAVRGPLWHATLSNRGGAILSWTLSDYADAGGDPVELVLPGERGLEVEVRYGTAEIETGHWTFEHSGPREIVLEEGARPATVRFEGRRADGVSVIKEYTFYSDSYLFDLSVDVRGFRESAGRREIWIGWPGILPTEAKEEDRVLASSAFVDEKLSKDNLGSLKKVESKRHLGNISWVTSQTKYFMCAAVPDTGLFSEVTAVGDVDSRTVAVSAAAPIEQGGGRRSLRVYLGPQDYALLEEIGVGLERAVDLGWSITRPLSILMLKALVAVHRVIPNYGVVIILFSVITKILFYRLTHKSFVEMKRMQDVQPKLEELKKKHAKDKEALAKAQMELYKSEGVNPLGGCGPMLLQMPVFIALFQVLRTTIELRGAPFVAWITDLSMPDTIAHVAGFPIHILPLLMGVGMLVQQRMTSRDPSQAMLGNMMPIIFTALFYNFASGLVIYWLVNTVLSVAQQYYIHRGPSSTSAAPSDASPRRSVPGQDPASTTATEPPAFNEAETVAATASPSGTKKRKKRRKKK